MRNIGIMAASENDLKKQGRKGLLYLQTQSEQHKVVGVNIASIHRNTEVALQTMDVFSQMDLDAVVMFGGMSLHLPGIADAYLRYKLNNLRMVVIASVLEDAEDPVNTAAAILSIVRVPSTQVVFRDFIGEEGFLRACKFAIEGDLPAIKSVTPRQTYILSLNEAIKKYTP